MNSKCQGTTATTPNHSMTLCHMHPSGILSLHHHCALVPLEEAGCCPRALPRNPPNIRCCVGLEESRQHPMTVTGVHPAPYLPVSPEGPSRGASDTDSKTSISADAMTGFQSPKPNPSGKQIGQQRASRAGGEPIRALEPSPPRHSQFKARGIQSPVVLAVLSYAASSQEPPQKSS